MKFSSRRNDIIVNGIRHGFSQKDSIYLNRQTQHEPKTQVWSAEELEPEPEQRQYWCAICKSPLEYLKGSETIWECSSCLEFYDTRIQDSPIKDQKDFKLTPYSQLMHYPQYDSDDPTLPFVEGVDLNKIVENDLETREHDDRRVQHINLHNVTFADAMLFSNVLSAKKQSDHAQQEL